MSLDRSFWTFWMSEIEKKVIAYNQSPSLKGLVKPLLKDQLFPNEYKMLACCGMKDMLEHELSGDISVREVYRMAVEWCFVQNKEGPVVEALRIAYLNIWTQGVSFRDFCSSFDELIGEKMEEKGN